MILFIKKLIIITLVCPNYLFKILHKDINDLLFIVKFMIITLVCPNYFFKILQPFKTPKYLKLSQLPNPQIFPIF